MVGKAARVGGAAVAALLLGCGSLLGDDDGPLPEGLPCDASRSPVNSHGGLSYDSKQSVCVQLSMPQSSFEQLAKSDRFGTGDPFREVLQHITRDCTTPFPKGYPWFQADLDVAESSLSGVGVRKKGFLGSVTGHGMLKPSLRIKTDKYQVGQELGRDERVVLNNAAQDALRIRTCLAYDIFRRASYPAPRCNLAGVMLNEEPLGAYVHVEPFDRAFLRREFGSDKGSLYEGTLVDFTAEFLNGDELGRWEAKNSDTDPSGAPLLALQKALHAKSGKAAEAIDTQLNVERFIRFWALEILIGHRDGYTANRNNFFVYFDPNDSARAVFLPWGADDVLEDVDDAPATATSNYAFAEVPRRLSLDAQRYMGLKAELSALLDGVWEEEWLGERIDLYVAQVAALEARPDLEEETRKLKAWVRDRPDVVRAQLSSEGVRGAPTAASCFALGLEGGLGLIQEVSRGVGAYNSLW